MAARPLARVLLAVVASALSWTRAAPEPRPPQTHALLVNGGSAPAKNYLSHLHHLQDMVAALRGRGIEAERIHVFSADGEDPKPDLATRGSEPPDLWLIEGTAAGRALAQPALTNTVWEGVSLHPARLAELRRWFARMRSELRSGDVLLVFVTDHGAKNPDDADNGFISLWNESLSVLEFRALLGYLRPGVRVVSLMSQCYSGAFADAMTPLHSDVPSGDFCGFYSTTRDRPAYGCYPEGRDRDRIGHAFRSIDALTRYAAMDDVHAAVLVGDTTPDVPLRTSDLFLERVVEDEAARRKLDRDALVDELLEGAWKSRARWERELRLLDRIGEAYGTFSTRTLAELKSRTDSLESLDTELETYADRWKLALDALRKDNLERFLEDNAAWKERLDEKKLESQNAEEKRGMLHDLLPAVKEFTARSPEISRRLEALEETEGEAREAHYRVAVRLAALLRLRTLLTRIAGTELVSQAHEPGERSEWSRSLEALEDCERSTIGAFAGREGPFPPEAPEVLPPFDQDLDAVRKALPSWLGIQFRRVPDAERRRLTLERGAVVVAQVYPDAPAGAAGLRSGDILLGPKEQHFVEPSQIREWTMTSPRGTPLAIDVLREEKPLEVSVSLVPLPTKLPTLPAPPKKGDPAPALGSLRMVRSASGGDPGLPGGRRLLFFWATWCGPCKNSLPELLAWSRKAGVPVIAISDEDQETIRRFLDGFGAPFPEIVASDSLRVTSVAYGVSGTPTFVLVDAQGMIEWRGVGYSSEKHLQIPGGPGSP